MEKKLLGIIISVLGIAGLIVALININGAINNEHIGLIFAGGVLSAVAFFAGITLVPYQRTTDKTVKIRVNELVDQPIRSNS
jgi:hypothetical protein